MAVFWNKVKQQLPALGAGIAIGVGVGVAASAAVAMAKGYLPVWFGPEKKPWSSGEWSADAQKVLDELSSETKSAGKPGTGSTRSFIYSARHESRRIRAHYFFEEDKRRLRGVVKFGADCEGPPNCVHGGAIGECSMLLWKLTNGFAAAIADSLLGRCAWNAGFKCVTANLNASSWMPSFNIRCASQVNYRKFLPLGNEVYVEAQVDREDGPKKVFLNFAIRSLDKDTLHAEGTGLFIRIQDLGQAPKK